MAIHLQKIFAIRRPFRNMLKLWRHASIHVAPSTPSHVSEILKITGNGFTPNLKLTIQGQLNCASEYLKLQSYAHVMTDADGCFDLCTTASVGGSYTGIDGMGLFWAMEKRNDSLHDAISLSNGLAELEYEFCVFNGHICEFHKRHEILCSTTCIRFCGDKMKIKRENIEVGNIRGTLFVPIGDGPFPGIITIRSSMKRLHVVEDHSALLASYGYVTIALAYFGVNGLPENFTSQPLRIEYFEEAFNYLSNHSIVEGNNIGVFGVSKGGDIALAMMSHLPQIKAICTFNGAISSIGCSTTYRDKITKETPVDLSKICPYTEGKDVINIRDALPDLRDHAESIHPFENSNADLLIIVGLDDWNWRSEEMADVADERMKASGKTNYKISKYDNMGHNLTVPFTPGIFIGRHSMLPKSLKVYYGGLKNKRKHINEVTKAWDEILEFFHKSLKSNK